MINIERKFILYWLQESDPEKLTELWEMADGIRKKNLGNQVHLRGLIEISNYCIRLCGYCGLRADRTNLQRYRMSKQEILDCVKLAVEYGYGTVVLQAGEDYGITQQWLSEIVNEIKSTTPLAITLSMGERPLKDIKAWRNTGADRYLLRFETSDQKLYNKIHPSLPKDELSRVDMLRKIKSLGYEAGSGIMVGIPGQTYETIADDILLFKDLDLDMIGIGPYIAHSETPIYNASNSGKHQVPNTELMTYKVLALSRIACPQANIPSTTALATLNKDTGRENGLSRGANVVMPNLTPLEYRKYYEIYPSKVCINENADDCRFCMQRRIFSIGRQAGKGPGNRKYNETVMKE